MSCRNIPKKIKKKYAENGRFWYFGGVFFRGLFLANSGSPEFTKRGMSVSIKEVLSPRVLVTNRSDYHYAQLDCRTDLYNS